MSPSESASAVELDEAEADEDTADEPCDEPAELDEPDEAALLDVLVDPHPARAAAIVKTKAPDINFLKCFFIKSPPIKYFLL
jgi:hypothetical protein